MDLDELHTTAQLALLDLPDTGKVAVAFSEMIDHFSRMMEVDIATLEPTTHALSRENRVRSDIPDDKTDRSDHPETLLKQAPDSADRFFRIPNVL